MESEIEDQNRASGFETTVGNSGREPRKFGTNQGDEEMKRFGRVAFLGALALALTLSGVSLARPPFEHGGPPRDPGAFIEEHAEALLGLYERCRVVVHKSPPEK